MQNVVEWEITDFVTVKVQAVSGGQRKVTAYYTGGDDPEVLHADTYPERFYEQRTARGEIKNAVSDALGDTPVEPDDWERAWKQKMSEMVAQSDDAKAELVPENVRQIAEGTQSVYVTMGGETRKWEITIEWNGKTGEIVLDHNDMAGGGTMAVKSQMFKEFANSPYIQQEDWDALKSFWIEQQEERAIETMTEMDRVVESFVTELRTRVTYYDDPEKLKADKESAWVDWGNSHGVKVTDDLTGVVWVRSDLVTEIVNSIENAPRIGELGGELGKREYTVQSSQSLKPAGDGSKRRYWYFDPDKLGVTQMDVQTSGESRDATGAVDA